MSIPFMSRTSVPAGAAVKASALAVNASVSLAFQGQIAPWRWAESSVFVH